MMEFASLLSTENIRLEAELAESKRVNAKLNEEHRDLAEKLAAANAKIEAARESDRIDLLLALGIESPKPTDNSEDAT